MQTPSLVSRFKVRVAASFRNLTSSHQSSLRLAAQQSNDEENTPKVSNFNLSKGLAKDRGERIERSEPSVGVREPQQLEFLSVFDGPITVIEIFEMKGGTRRASPIKCPPSILSSPYFVSKVVKKTELWSLLKGSRSLLPCYDASPNFNHVHLILIFFNK